MESSPLTSLLPTSNPPSDSISTPITATIINKRTYGSVKSSLPSASEIIPETDFTSSDQVVIPNSETGLSIAPSSSNKSHHTSDPTTEEEKGKNSPTPNIIDSSKNVDAFMGEESSSDDDGNAEDSIISKFMKKSVLQEMKDFDEAFDANLVQPMEGMENYYNFDNQEPIFNPFDNIVKPIQNPFDPITPQQELEITSKGAKDRYRVLSSEITPTVENSKATFDRDGSSPVGKTTQPAGFKAFKPTRARIIDSEEESDGEPLPTKAKPIQPTSNSLGSNSDDSSSDEATVPSPVPTLAAPELTGRERIAALAAARGAKVEEARRTKLGKEKKVVREVVESDEEEQRFDNSDDEIVEVKKKRVSNPRGLSKTAQEEMHRETARLIRIARAEITPASRGTLSVADTLKFLDRPVQKLNPTQKFSYSSPKITSTSSDPIAPTSTATRLSEKQQGKLRQLSIGLEEKLPTQAFVAIEIEEESQQESYNTSRAKYVKLEKEREFKERKISLVKKVIESDSDSDIEIIGAPTRNLSNPTTSLSTFKRPISLGRKYQNLNGNKTVHDDFSETQIISSGRTYGKNLSSGPTLIEPTTKPAISRRSQFYPKKVVNASVTHEDLNKALFSSIHKKNAIARESKQTKYHKEKGLQQELQANLQSKTNLSQILKDKQVKIKERRITGAGSEEEEEDDIEDDDYQIGSDQEERPEDIYSGQSEQEEEDQQQQSSPPKENQSIRAHSNRLSTSPTSSSREILGEIPQPETDEEKENEPLVIVPRRQRVIVDDDEEDSDNEMELDLPVLESTTPPIVEVMPILPARMNLPGFGEEDEGGFSQFFADDFSQNLGNVNNVEGFQKPVATMGKESNFIAPILIDAAGRAEDAARIEALGGFRVQDPVTPKVVPPKRQYINKDGFMTQNRPMNPFEVSPRSAEDDALPLVQFDSFDTQTQTQLETQSPTRIPSNRSKSSFTERAPSPTELQATEEQHEEEEDSQLGLPSAQPRPPVPRNAFDVLLAPAPIAPAPKTKANRANVGNAFIDTEANLSDEEIMGMGLGETGSGDEDETREDFDSELMELVDNEKVEEELLLQQDRLARERAAIDEAADDAKREAGAKGVIDGKLRNGKRGNNGGLGNFSDDEFDDDNYGISNREKRQRVLNATIDSLALDPETQAFAQGHNETLSIQLKENEHDYLNSMQGQSSDEDEDDEPRISRYEAERMMSEAARKRSSRESVEPVIHISGKSSSPMPILRVHNRVTKNLLEKDTFMNKLSTVEDFDDIDSQYVNQHRDLKNKALYAFDPKEDSQNSNGNTGKATSAVTGYLSNASGKSTSGGNIVAGQHGKNVVVSRSSMKYRKNKFT